MIPQEIIRKKRDRQELTLDEINAYVTGVTNGDVSEGQIAAMSMAIFFNGLSVNETVNLTRAMTQSGKVLKWQGLNGPVVDKHSTGGVGDKVSIMLAPIVAACGVYVPMICGRGLGHTGGTFDKFEAIPGYNTELSWDLFEKTVKEIGCCIIGQTQDLAPADKKIYAIRDVTATVESINLITASILSKKIAAGLEGLVMDIKVGSGAFMTTMEQARELGQSIISVACGAGVKTSALITDMNQVLGRTAGHANEMRESVEFMKNEKVDSRLWDVTMSLAAEMLVNGGVVQTVQEGRKKAEEAVHSGKALEKFALMVKMAGGPADFVEKYQSYLPLAKHRIAVYPKEGREGYVKSINTRDLGLSIIELGGGRCRPSDKIDHRVGLSEVAGVGEFVGSQAFSSKPLCFIDAEDDQQAQKAAQMIQSAFTLSQEKCHAQDVIKEYLPSL